MKKSMTQPKKYTADFLQKLQEPGVAGAGPLPDRAKKAYYCRRPDHRMVHPLQCGRQQRTTVFEFTLNQRSSALIRTRPWALTFHLVGEISTCLLFLLLFKLRVYYLD